MVRVQSLLWHLLGAYSVAVFIIYAMLEARCKQDWWVSWTDHMFHVLRIMTYVYCGVSLVLKLLVAMDSSHHWVDARQKLLPTPLEELCWTLSGYALSLTATTTLLIYLIYSTGNLYDASNNTHGWLSATDLEPFCSSFHDAFVFAMIDLWACTSLTRFMRNSYMVMLEEWDKQILKERMDEMAIDTLHMRQSVRTTESLPMIQTR